LSIALLGYFLDKAKQRESAQQQAFAMQQEAQQRAVGVYHQEVQPGQSLARPVMEHRPVTPVEVERLQREVQAAQHATELSYGKTEAVPQHSQHQEHSWYEGAVDREGKIVEGTAPRSYQQERAVEHADRSFAQYSAGPATVLYDGAGNPVRVDSSVHFVQDAQAAPVPAAVPAFPTPQSPPPLTQKEAFMKSMSHPWVWVGLAVLLLAFFIAAFL
jgi:hypothetical protein